jgi:Homing endonuclease associated repeat
LRAFGERNVTKEEIIAAIRSCADELGRVPTVANLKEMKRVSLRTIRRFYGRYADALREAGFDPHGAGYKLDLETLFRDWAGVARRVGKIPSLLEYSKQSRYSVGPLLTRFGGWTEVPRGLLQFARERELEKEWGDVVQMMEAHENRKRCAAKSSITANGKCKKELPLYGHPLSPGTLVFAPTNEMGVVYLLGMMASQLGIVVTRLQPGFPDGEVMREVENGRWQRRIVEFEHESRNFLIHKHDPNACDMIICWVHNWPECPEWIEVVELSRELRKVR